MTQEAASSWTKEQVRSAYRKRTLQVHPDKTKENVVRFRRVTAGYEYLCDAENHMEAAIRWLPSLDEPRPRRDESRPEADDDDDMQFWNRRSEYVMPGVALAQGHLSQVLAQKSRTRTPAQEVDKQHALVAKNRLHLVRKPPWQLTREQRGDTQHREEHLQELQWRAAKAAADRRLQRQLGALAKR